MKGESNQDNRLLMMFVGASVCGALIARLESKFGQIRMFSADNTKTPWTINMSWPDSGVLIRILFIDERMSVGVGQPSIDAPDEIVLNTMTAQLIVDEINKETGGTGRRDVDPSPF